MLDKIDESEGVSDIRWVTGSGLSSIANWLSTRLNRININIITTNEIIKKWQNTREFEELTQYANTVNDVGNTRFIIINNKDALVGIPLFPRQHEVNFAMSIKEPSRINELISTFDSWNENL